MNSTVARPVVVGIDGTPGSAGALRYAAREARVRGCGLVLLHVWPNEGVATPPGLGLHELETLGLEILDQGRATALGLAPGCDVETVLMTGGRPRAILHAAQDAQLVVVGLETRVGLERMAPGPTAVQVAGHADCPVVAVPSFWVERDLRGHVVVGVAGRDHSNELLAHAFDAARSRSARLTVVHVWSLPDPSLDRIETRTHVDDLAAQGQAMLVDLTSTLHDSYPNVELEFRVLHGAAVSVLLNSAREADLLLIGRRRHALPPHWWLGGTAQALLRLAETPVELVPALSAFSSEGPDPELAVEGLGTLAR